MPTEEANRRRLTVILSADVAGYSRLMGEDDEGTLSTLATYQEVIGALISEHQGRIFGMAGDSIIAEFASAVESVRCAVSIQRALDRRNVDLPTNRRMAFRIGINLGDVIVREADLYGDGVNVAARLQAMAEPGGICISGSVHEQIEGKINFGYAFLGEKSLKNIARPVRVYGVDWSIEKQAIASAQGGVALPLPSKPSIAVLPFTNMSGDTEQEYFADGLTEDLITALAKFRWFFVIARNSSFTYKGRSVSVQHVGRELGVRFVLEGSTRKSGDRVRVTAQLIDAATGHHLWAERYDRNLADLFAVQDEIVQRVVGAIEPAMLKTETQRAQQKTAQALNAWDLTCRGMWHFYQVTKENHVRARELFREVTATAPDLAEGYTWIGRTSAGLIMYGWSENPAADAAEGWQAAQRAVRLAETDPYAHYAVGIVSVARAQPLKAIEAAQRAIDLSPSYALGFLLLGTGRVLAGRAAQAIEPLQQGLRLSPHDPQTFIWLQLLAYACFLKGDHEDAVRHATDAIAARPESFFAYGALACALVHLGRADEAKKAIVEMWQNISGGQSQLEGFLARFFHPNDREKILAGFRQAE